MLAKIDPQIYISNFDRAKAALKSAQANEAQAKARFTQAKAQLTRINKTLNAANSCGKRRYFGCRF